VASTVVASTVVASTVTVTPRDTVPHAAAVPFGTLVTRQRGLFTPRGAANQDISGRLPASTGEKAARPGRNGRDEREDGGPSSGQPALGCPGVAHVTRAAGVTSGREEPGGFSDTTACAENQDIFRRGPGGLYAHDHGPARAGCPICGDMNCCGGGGDRPSDGPGTVRAVGLTPWVSHSRASDPMGVTPTGFPGADGCGTTG
jgi:hypothetical protein